MYHISFFFFSSLYFLLLDTNEEEKDKLGSEKKEEMLALADSCLVLAKAGNVELAPTFLANLKDIQGALTLSIHTGVPNYFLLR